MQETHVQSMIWEDPLEKEIQPTPVFLSGESQGQESLVSCHLRGHISACNAGDLGSIPGLGRSPGEGKDSPLQYSGMENSMDCVVHGVTKSQTSLHFHPYSIELLLHLCQKSAGHFVWVFSGFSLPFQGFLCLAPHWCSTVLIAVDM